MGGAEGGAVPAPALRRARAGLGHGRCRPPRDRRVLDPRAAGGRGVHRGVQTPARERQARVKLGHSRKGTFISR